MEINGVISYPPVANPPAGNGGSGAQNARTDSAPDANASGPSAIAQATMATQAAVEAVSGGEHDAAEGTRRAVVALAAAIGSPQAAQIVAQAAQRFKPIEIHHAAPVAVSAPEKAAVKEHTAVHDVSSDRDTTTPTLTQRTSSGELANSVSGNDQARQARHDTEKYIASIKAPTPSEVQAYA